MTVARTAVGPAGRQRRVPRSHVYEAIVVGDSVEGALAAALLARRGVRALYVANPVRAATYVDRGVALPAAPFLLPAFSHAPALAAALGEVGLVESTCGRKAEVQVLRRRRYATLPPAGQDRAGVLGEAAAVELAQLEEAGRRIGAWIDEHPDFPPRGVVARWRFRRGTARSLPRWARTLSPELEPLRAALPVAGYRSAPSPESAALVLGGVTAGASLVPGGPAALTALLVDAAASAGAEVLDADEAVEAILVDGRRFSAIRLPGNDAAIRAPALVWASGVESLARQFPQATSPESVPVADAAVLVTVNATVPARAVPRGLGDLCVLGTEEGPPLLMLVQPEPRAEAVRRDPKRTRTLTFAVMRSPPGDADSELRALARAVDPVLPFLWGAVTEASVAPRGADVDAHPLWSVPPESWLGLAGPREPSAIAGLVTASREALAGLGLDGAARAALRAVARVERLLGRRPRAAS